MKTVRIYEPGSYEPGQTITLSESASQHIGLVLRMKPPETICLFRGDNREFSAQIMAVHKRAISVYIDSMQPITRESPRPIHLAQTLSKGDRMEWVIQKSVELGVTCITPILSARCVVRLDNDRSLKKIAQWTAIAIAACEQSGRNVIPLIRPIINLPLYLQQCHAPTKLLLHPSTQNNLRTYTLPPGEISLLIGPEGGFQEEEVALTTQTGFQPITLGPRILRTETAAIAAISLLQGLFGDL